MAIYKGLLLTNNVDQNGMKFDKKVIKGLLKDQPTVPVKIGSIGNAKIGSTIAFIAFYNKPDVIGLVVEFTCQMEHLDELGLYIVPSGTCDYNSLILDDDNRTVISDFTLTEVIITSKPSDASLAPFTAHNIGPELNELGS